MQNFKSQFGNRFSGEPEGEHGILLKNIVKLRYLRNEGLENQTNPDFSIAHKVLSNEYGPGLKALWHLKSYSREMLSISITLVKILLRNMWKY